MPSKRMVIPSDLNEVCHVQAALGAMLDEARISDDEKFGIRLSLDEAIANAIRHGNRQDPDKMVTIDLSVDPRQVRICVTDEGPGFNPGKVPDPTLDENLDKPFGRGILLMRSYMSRVEYNRRGNRVVLVRKRNEPISAP